MDTLTLALAAILLLPAGSPPGAPGTIAAPAATTGRGAFAAAVPSTADYAKSAAIGHLFATEISGLAREKSQSPAVQSFAEQMLSDRAPTNREIEAAFAGGQSDGAPPRELDVRHQKLLDELQSKSGPDFDRRYWEIQRQAHREEPSLHRSYARNGQDPAMKRVAGEILPVVQRHIDILKQQSSQAAALR